MTKAELDAIRPADRADFTSTFNRVFHSADGTRHTGVFQRTFSGVPRTTTDKDHPEDDGWYFPVVKTEMIIGNKAAYAARISQAAYQTLKNKRT